MGPTGHVYSPVQNPRLAMALSRAARSPALDLTSCTKGAASASCRLKSHLTLPPAPPSVRNAPSSLSLNLKSPPDRPACPLTFSHPVKGPESGHCKHHGQAEAHDSPPQAQHFSAIFSLHFPPLGYCLVDISSLLLFVPADRSSVVCDFNVDLGPEVLFVYPPDTAFSQADLTAICFNR